MFLEKSPSRTGVPFILVCDERYQLRRTLVSQVHFDRFVGVRPRHPIETPIGAIPALDIVRVTVLCVHPVDHVNRTVRAVLEVDADELRIRSVEMIGSRMNRLVS